MVRSVRKCVLWPDIRGVGHFEDMKIVQLLMKDPSIFSYWLKWFNTGHWEDVCPQKFRGRPEIHGNIRVGHQVYIKYWGGGNLVITLWVVSRNLVASAMVIEVRPIPNFLGEKMVLSTNPFGHPSTPNTYVFVPSCKKCINP